MKMTKMMSIMTAAVMTVGMLAGCGGDETAAGSAEMQAVPVSGKTDTVVITTIRANQPIPNTDIIAAAVQNTCTNGGHLTLIAADGSPSIAADAPYDRLTVIGKGERETQLADLAGEIIQQTALKCVADDPESDIMSALHMASDALSDSDNNKQLVLYDNCLSTSGAVVFQDSKDGLSSIDLDGLLTDLKENNEIPSLQNVAIDVYGIGMTSKPQSELSNTEQQLLQDFWEDVLYEAGAASVTFHTISNCQSSAEVEGLPEVAVVPVAEEGDYVSNNLITEPITFDETAIAFEDNSNALKSRQDAVQALKEVAKTLNEHPQEIYVAGTTAYAKTATEEGYKSRSLGRAETVCQLLTDEFGIDRSLLHPVGMGCGGPFYHAEKGSEEIAKSNRSVTLVACDSETGREIKDYLKE